MATNQHQTDDAEQASTAAIANEESTKNKHVVDMDDTTGSDGGPTTTRSSQEDDDYTDDSQRDRKHLSRSDTSRVDGMGVSGGTGDADSAQSGGRSQY